MILLAVDPGLLHPAAAVFEDGELKKASRVKIPKGINTKTPIGARCKAISFAVAEWADVAPNTVVIEWPKIYTAGKSKGDPNLLLPLVGIGMCIAGFFPDCELLSPLPSEWTGQVPKATSGDAWLSARGIKIKKRLSESEIACIDVSHDSLDSVGLGLWALGRYDRLRVYDES